MDRHSASFVPRRFPGAALAVALLLVLAGCGGGGSNGGSNGGGSGGGSGGGAFEPTYAITLTWDQPDSLAEYFQAQTGSNLQQVTERSATFSLTAASHDIQLRACNAAGCSGNTTVTVDRQNNAWVIVSEKPPSGVRIASSTR